MPGGEGRGIKDVVQGSWIFRALGVSVGGGLFMAVVVAFIGVVLVIGAQRMIWAHA